MIQPFKGDESVVFSIITELCNKAMINLRTFSSPQKETAPVRIYSP